MNDILAGDAESASLHKILHVRIPDPRLQQFHIRTPLHAL